MLIVIVLVIVVVLVEVVDTYISLSKLVIVIRYLVNSSKTYVHSLTTTMSRLRPKDRQIVMVQYLIFIKTKYTNNTNVTTLKVIDEGKKLIILL